MTPILQGFLPAQGARHPRWIMGLVRVLRRWARTFVIAGDAFRRLFQPGGVHIGDFGFEVKGLESVYGFVIHVILSA
jgi:hypothetical protein